MDKQKFIKALPASLLLCMGGGWLIGWLTGAEPRDWYNQLIKPWGMPPSIVFPIVWMILYFFMGVALSLLWASKTRYKQKAFLLFGVQLGLNFIWSWIFFSLHAVGIALLDILLLWVFLFWTIKAFWRHTPFGSILLMPYLAWVCYALYLNLFIWLLN